MIRVGIAGYGNLGRGAAAAVRDASDLELEAIFTRRPSAVAAEVPGVSVKNMDVLPEWEHRIDVLILCGGSAADLPAMTPALARRFHVVDSFDTHACIPAHVAAVEEAAAQSGHTALISAGWDPGLFSLWRLYGEAFFPEGATHTFWGPGVSQGHSDALRRVNGVADARQYTLPIPEAVERARGGVAAPLRPEESHTRLCYVAAEEGADRREIEERIRTMPHYFAGYDTKVIFLSPEELAGAHSALPHGGTVIRSGGDGAGMECRLKLPSNPRFTGRVLAACARAVYRMAEKGRFGGYTLFDVPPVLFSPAERAELISRLL